MKSRQAQAYEAMKGQFEGLLGRLQVLLKPELLLPPPIVFFTFGGRRCNLFHAGCVLIVG